MIQHSVFASLNGSFFFSLSDEWYVFGLGLTLIKQGDGVGVIYHGRDGPADDDHLEK